MDGLCRDEARRRLERRRLLDRAEAGLLSRGRRPTPANLVESAEATP